MAAAFPNTFSLTHRLSSIPSAPNISGTSVSTVEPPRAITMSLNAPTVGFAVTPDRPSDPPHFRPITSSLTGTASRRYRPAYDAHCSSSVRPAANSSSTSWQVRNLTRSASYSPSSSTNWSCCRFSHPRLSTSTAPAFGCRASAASSFLVCAWSSPVWLHPYGCGNVYSPSMLPLTKSWLSDTSFFATSLTQPTVGMIQISFRTAARPSSLR